MKRAKISVIFGTRPEAIKMAPVIKQLQQHEGLEAHVCVTGQHREMLDQVLETFGIQPDADLQVMQPNQTLASLTARLMTALDAYLLQEKPNMVLVQGDTTSAFSGALAAFYRQIPVGHIEAGLRTNNILSPWPEEGNRSLIGRLTALHFAPTETNRAHLRREGIDDNAIFTTGNTVIDALFLARERIIAKPPMIPGLPAQLMHPNNKERVVLITGHRRENLGQGFQSICEAIATLADRFPTTHFVYPVHLNPRVRETVFGILRQSGAGGDIRQNVHLIEPLSYLPFVSLMNRATMLLTDSGGIQEEAPGLGKPVLVMRDTTERTEAVEAGTVRLVGTSKSDIIYQTSDLLTNKAAYDQMAQANNPYGDGTASKQIIRHCAAFLGLSPSLLDLPQAA